MTISIDDSDKSGCTEDQVERTIKKAELVTDEIKKDEEDEGEAGEEEAPQHKEAYLRGRHLKGAELPLPDGYAAVVLEKHEVGGWTDLDKSHASWRAAGACGPITYWNHTTNPGEADPQRRALDFISFQQSIM